MDNPKGGENLLGRVTNLPAEHPDFPGFIIIGMIPEGTVTQIAFRDFDIYLRDNGKYAATAYHHAARDLDEVWVEDDCYSPMSLAELFPFLTDLYAKALTKRLEIKAHSLREWADEAVEYYDLAGAVESIRPANRATRRVIGDCLHTAAGWLIKRAVLERHAVPAGNHDQPWGRVIEYIRTKVKCPHCWEQTDDLRLLVSTLWPEQPALYSLHGVEAWAPPVFAKLRSADLWGTPLVTQANLLTEKALFAQNMPAPDWAKEDRPLLLRVRHVAGLVAEQSWATEKLVSTALLLDVLDRPGFTQATLQDEVGAAVVDLLMELRTPQGPEWDDLPTKQKRRREQARLAGMSLEAKRITLAAWVCLLADHRMDGVTWGRLLGQSRVVAEAVGGADEALHQRLLAAWTNRR